MKYTLFSWLFLCFGLIAFGQISQKRPIKSNLLQNNTPINYLSLPSIDIESVLLEDALEMESKEVARRFGIPITLDVDFYSEASRTLFPDGSIIYRLGFSTIDAKTLNIIFNYFDLPEVGWMHIYDPSKKDVLGAFTEKNESKDYNFATTLLASDSLIIEIYRPSGSGKGKINIHQIIYGYRNFDNGIENFGSSGNCNINVTCPEGQPWINQSQAVVLILTGGANNRLCTGTMINNVDEDGKPFMLSADHCPIGPNNVIIYNYQSSQCDPSKDSSFAHAVNGLTILSRNNKSDFLLTELSSKPPSNYKAYYAGWNKSGDIPLNTVGIHHPQGDVKKISFDYDASNSSGYYTSGNSHWKVAAWDLGTTEVVSSGSPLFNERKQIVGQLHGGDASCQFPEKEDYYGKFSSSWNDNSDSTKQLKYWLDPNNTGASAIPGNSPNFGTTNYDLALFGFTENSSDLCEIDSIAPTVLIKNRGLLAINKFGVKYYLNGILIQDENLSVTLQPNDFFKYTPTFIKVNSGYYNLKAEVYIVGNNDGNTSNNFSFTGISVTNNSILVELTLKTNNDGNEISWELGSSTGSLLHSGGGYQSIPGGKIYKDTFCLYDGCFTYTIFDDYGDGLCCGFGSGYYVLKNLISGDTIIQDYNFKSSDTTHSFCLGDSCSIRAKAIIKHVSSTGASDGEINLDMLSGLAPFKFSWSNGDTSQSIFNLSSGIYSVLIQDSLNCIDSIFYEIGIGTGIDESKLHLKNIVIYPNPTTGLVTIKGLTENENYQINLYDLRGRLILLKKVNAESDIIQLNISELNKGIYFLTIVGNENAVTMRIVKTGSF